jgi:aspartyl-tRNA synthetase
MRLSAANNLTRKELTEAEELVKRFGAKGLAWIKWDPSGPVGPLARFLNAEMSRTLMQAVGAQEGDQLLMVADQAKTALASLGQLRLWIGRKFKLFDPAAMAFTWVLDFPLLEWSPEERRWAACHHPFTSPREEDLPLLKSDPGKVIAQAYDIVLNGIELGGGSLRIHDQEVQKAVFHAIQLSDEEARHKFGFLLDALSYGAPPHGGIALGLDRFVMLMVGAESIRDVIAYPKTASGSCLMTSAPSDVSEAQLQDLGLGLRRPPAKPRIQN